MRRRTLCLDVGDKRIGVAVSDPLGLTAQPLQIIERTQFKKDCETLFKLVKEYDAVRIVIGLPFDLNHQEGPQAQKVRFFFTGLQKFLQEKKSAAALELFDESFSSQEAESILLEADLSRQKRKKVRDKLAAALILQNYLDEKK